MSAASYEHLATAVVENAKWVDRVLLASGSTAGIIVLLKLAGKSELTWQDVPISVDHSWVIFLIYTAGHLYATFLLVRSAHLLWMTDEAVAKDTFEKVVASGGLSVRGLSPRVTNTTIWSIFRAYRMEYSDPTAWLSVGSALLTILAIIPFSATSIWKAPVGAIGALAVVAANWLIGSHWAIALSELSIARDASTYHARMRDRREDRNREDDDDDVIEDTGCPPIFCLFFLVLLIALVGLLVSLAVWLQ